MQVLSDLNTAASELGLGPRPLNVTVAPDGDDDDDNDDDDENKEEGEVIMVRVDNGLSGERRTQPKIMYSERRIHFSGRYAVFVE